MPLRIRFPSNRIRPILVLWFITYVSVTGILHFAAAQTIDKDQNALDHRVVVEVNAKTRYIYDRLSEIGFKFETEWENLLQGTLSEGSLDELASLPFVLSYREATHAIQFALTNEAVNHTRANFGHSFGLTGKGVKVALLDVGFDPSLMTFPQNIIETRSFRSDGDIRALNPRHGTAVAEVLVGVAPDLELYLYNYETEVEFLNAVDFAIRRGVKIISTATGFLNLGPYDGTSRPSRALDRARSMGILPIVAAGNAGQSHWSGKFNDQNGNGLHEFFGADERNAVELTRGERIEILLSWDDWPASTQNYDLLLQDAQGRTVAASTTAQRGSQPPTEAIRFAPTSTGTYYIVIRRVSASRDVNFDLFVSPNNVQYFVAGGSIAHLADARGALTVGASSIPDDKIQPYSSRGPTKDGRIKPDIVAPDGITVSVLRAPFRGTSPSAPVVTGIAALLLSGNPNLTPDELQALLEKTAVDLGPVGKDNLYGSGRVNVKFPYIASNPKVSPIAVDGVVYQPSERARAFIWPFGSEHMLSIPSPNLESGGMRYGFRGWSDGYSQATRRIIYDASQELIEALFATQYRLSVESGFGRMAGDGWYDPGSVASFSVTPIVDHNNGTRRVFRAWEDDFSGRSPNGTLVIDSPKNIRATWKVQYLINLRTKAGDVEGGGWHDKASQVILKANPSVLKGSNLTREVFVSWSGSIKGDSPQVALTVTGPISAEAIWKKQHFLKVASDLGSPKGEGWYDEGSIAQFSIEPKVGPLGEQVFDGWGGDLKAQTNKASIGMDSPKVVIARWRQEYAQTALVAAVIIVGIFSTAAYWRFRK